MHIRLLCLATFLTFATCASDIDTQKEFGDLDSADNLDEDEFEKRFGLEKQDPYEESRRREALKKNEEEVKRQNEDFFEGKKTWWDEIDEYDNLPADEFNDERNGEISPGYNGRGLIDYRGPETYDEASERYFDKFRFSRSFVPDSYSSVDLGYVSPVKNQKTCGSCVAFANMALIETCFKKLTRVFGDYSEQQLLDCGYNKNGANGCNGAWPFSYVKTIADSNMQLSHETNYLYKAKRQSCPSRLKPHNQGAKVTGEYHTWSGDEETLKRLVYEHGAVGTSVFASDGPLVSIQKYAGGIFSGCQSNRTSHAVVVVGYGTDTINGKRKDYWLIKNSWGKGWGENGFIRLERGVGMCGVGQSLVNVECGKVYGPTDAPLTTKAPCFDRWTDCPKRAETNCKKYGEFCEKSCGLCKGMTPHVSNTCNDQFSNCKNLATRACYQKKISDGCCLSCGLGEGMTPAESNTCYDEFGGCGNNKNFMCANYAEKCKKTCGTC